MRLVLPIEFRHEITFLGVPYVDDILVLVLVIFFASDEVRFHGTPLERGNIPALTLESDLLVGEVDYVDAILIDD